jgi:hypothetical protein
LPTPRRVFGSWPIPPGYRSLVSASNCGTDVGADMRDAPAEQKLAPGGERGERAIKHFELGRRARKARFDRIIQSRLTRCHAGRGLAGRRG